ncbi:MAG: hypothetical protein ACOC5S_05885 [Acidobacteriota bacterium]
MKWSENHHQKKNEFPILGTGEQNEKIHLLNRSNADGHSPAL